MGDAGRIEKHIDGSVASGTNLRDKETTPVWTLHFNQSITLGHNDPLLCAQGSVGNTRIIKHCLCL